MRNYLTILRLLRSALCVVACLLLVSGQSWSAEPTLARLSFWVPPERMDEFDSVFRDEVAPVLSKHGLSDPALPNRESPKGIYSRTFGGRT